MTVLPYDVLFRDHGASRGLADLAKKTDAASAATDKLAHSQQQQAAAERKAADAAGALKLAELKLQGVRKNSKSTAVQVLAAEENLAKAQRRLVGAQDAVKASSQRVTAAQKQIGQAAQQATQKVERSSSRLRAVGKIGGSSLKVIGVGAAAAVGGVGLLAGGLLGLAKVGLDAAAQNEQVGISFTTMLGSAKKAKTLLADLQTFAAQTPFEFPELQQATTKLLAFGFAQKEIIPNMRRLGDVAAGLGIPIGELSELYGKARVQGRLYMEDINQLTGRGIPVIQEFAKQFGVNESKVRKLVEAGKIGFPQLQKAIESLTSSGGKFSGLMEKQSKSLTGMLSTLKDTFGMGLAKAIQPALPFLKGAIGAVTKSLANFFSWVATHQEDVVEGIVNTGDAVLNLSKIFLQLGATGLRAISELAGSVGRLLEGMSKVPGWGGFKGAADAMIGLGSGARVAADAMEQDLIPKIDKAHKQWTAFGKDQRTKASLRDANQVIQRAIGTTNEALKKNGKTFDAHTAKGLANRHALGKLADAQVAYRDKLIASHAPTKKLDDFTEKARKTFIATAIKMKATKEEAKRMADAYGLTKDATDKAKRSTKQYDDAINGLNGKNINVSVKYKASATNVTAGFFLNVPGKAAQAFAKLGGPSKGHSLEGSIGAPTSAPVGGPTLGSSDFKVSTPGLDRARRMGQSWDDVATAAYTPLARRGMTTVGKAGLDYLNSLAMMGMTGPTGSVGAYSASMAGTIAALRRAGARSFTTYPGHHPSMAKARDVTPHNWKIANTARASRSVWYVIYQMKIASKNHGNNWRTYHPHNHHGDWQHRRHVHVAWYDKGGMLRPGWTMAYNGTGRNERVTPSGGGGGNTTIIINATHFSDAQALKRALVDLDRRGELQVIKR